MRCWTFKHHINFNHFYLGNNKMNHNLENMSASFFSPLRSRLISSCLDMYIINARHTRANTLLGTNISLLKAHLKMLLLFPRKGMLVPRGVWQVPFFRKHFFNRQVTTATLGRAHHDWFHFQGHRWQITHLKKMTWKNAMCYLLHLNTCNETHEDISLKFHDISAIFILF